MMKIIRRFRRIGVDGEFGVHDGAVNENIGGKAVVDSGAVEMLELESVIQVVMLGKITEVEWILSKMT